MNIVLKFFKKIYFKILRIFFDYDLVVFALKPTKAKVRKLRNIRATKTFNSHSLKNIEPIVKKSKFKNFKIKIRISKPLYEALVIRNFNEEFFQMLKIRPALLKFSVLARNYNLFLNNINNPPNYIPMELKGKVNSFAAKDINISYHLKTISEIIDVIPYTQKLPLQKVLQLPVMKYPVFKSKFKEEQIEIMKTKLAIQSKTKKYGMEIENIYDKCYVGLYDDVKLQRNSSIACTLKSSTAEAKEPSLLVTGKKKHDVTLTKTFIKYSEIGL